MRYLFSNTLVGGQPLDFHGDDRKILLGYFSIGILFTIYSAVRSADRWRDYWVFWWWQVLGRRC